MVDDIVDEKIGKKERRKKPLVGTMVRCLQAVGV
jgi:hypothetical protein